MKWEPITTAPKDGTKIWVFYDHDADPYQDPHTPYALTDYAANAEGMGFYKGKGQCVAVWQDAFEDGDWESGYYTVPGGWFPWLADEPSECVCNATHWVPLLDEPNG